MTTAAVEVRERPIIMSAPMVRATIDDRKTKTRRVVKLPPAWERAGMVLDGARVDGPPECRYLHVRRPLDQDGSRMDTTHRLFCPHGEPGDRLWVREAWSAPDACECHETCHIPGHVFYHADGDGHRSARFNRKRPSIHMPHWASRLTLEITGVRVEQVWDITEADAIAEGCAPKYVLDCTARDDFAQLWDSLNAKRGYPWASNPWVWVIEFTKEPA